MITATPEKIEMKHDGEIMKVRMTFQDGSELTVVGPKSGFNSVEEHLSDSIVAYKCTFEGFTPGEWED